jgi:hypothetical protein
MSDPLDLVEQSERQNSCKCPAKRGNNWERRGSYAPFVHDFEATSCAKRGGSGLSFVPLPKTELRRSIGLLNSVEGKGVVHDQFLD